MNYLNTYLLEIYKTLRSTDLQLYMHGVPDSSEVEPSPIQCYWDSKLSRLYTESASINCFTTVVNLTGLEPLTRFSSDQWRNDSKRPREVHLQDAMASYTGNQHN